MNINDELKELDENIHLYDDIVSSLSISMASARASRMALVARQRELKGFVVEAVDMLKAVRGMQGVNEPVSYRDRFDASIDFDYDDIDTSDLDQYGSDVLS
jgi:hypothetical protein